MIEYTKRVCRAGMDTLCYVTDVPVTSVTCTCYAPDKCCQGRTLERLTPNVFFIEYNFTRVGNYIFVLEIDGAVTSVLNAKVEA